MKKPIIGIIGRSEEEDNRSVIKINETYRLAVVASGGIPLVIVPPNDLNYGHTRPRDAKYLTEEEQNDFLRILKMCDGFIMPGGTRFYHFDEITCKYALDEDKPLLGICLGMQILGNIDNFFGNETSPKTIPNPTSAHMQEDKMYAHKVKIKPGLLQEILQKEELEVNSRHNYHIIEKPFFKVEALAEDGIIEAISIPNKKFALAVQWHPESMIEKEKIMLNIFKAFISSCTTTDEGKEG